MTEEDGTPTRAQDEATIDTSGLSYEQARDELVRIVSTLETGSAPLEETLRLWQRGEALAHHCQQILTAAQKKIDEAALRDSKEDASALD